MCKSAATPRNNQTLNAVRLHTLLRLLSLFSFAGQTGGRVETRLRIFENHDSIVTIVIFMYGRAYRTMNSFFQVLFTFFFYFISFFFLKRSKALNIFRIDYVQEEFG